MDWLEIVTLILSGGGVSYLVVEKMFSRRHDKAAAKGREVETSSQVVDLYKEVDQIVQSKTAPLEDKLDKALTELHDIKTHYCCYREQCADRLIYPQNNG